MPGLFGTMRNSRTRLQDFRHRPTLFENPNALQLDPFPSDLVTGHPLECSLLVAFDTPIVPRSESGSSALCVVVVRVDDLVESAPLKSIVHYSSTLLRGGAVALQ